jgi:hypothetical protein
MSVFHRVFVLGVLIGSTACAHSTENESNEAPISSPTESPPSSPSPSPPPKVLTCPQPSRELVEDYTGCGDMRGLQPGAAWPMEGFCPSRRSRTARPGPSSLTPLWNIDIGSTRLAPVIAADGTIYTINRVGVVHAVCSDGATKWTYDSGAKVTGSPLIGRDGTLYFR